MKPIMLFLWVALLVFQIVYCQVEFQGYNCTEEKIDRNKTLVYIGWPYTLKCGLFTNGFDVYDYEYGNTTINCLIWKSNGTLLLNITTDYEQFGYHSDEIEDVTLPDLNRDSNVDFQMYLIIPEDQRCFFLKIHLQLIPFKNQTCDEFIKSKHLKHDPKYEKDHKNMLCQVPEDVYPKVYNYDIVTYQWRRNCSALPQNTTLSSGNSSLNIKHLEYAQAGLYTCSITYHGMTRYISMYEVCMSSKQATTNHTLTCTENKKQKKVGEEAEFNCMAEFGGGSVEDNTFEFFWYKKGQRDIKKICHRANKASNYTSEISCFYEYTSKCFLNVATKEEQSRDESRVPVRLYFKNIKPDDFGQYILECSINLENRNLFNVTVSLEEDNNFKQTIIIVSLIACFVVLLLVIMMTAICFPIYFQVCYKRFFVPYTKENRTYGAYLVYNFSSESDVFIKEETTKTANKVTNILEKMGYSVYDHNKDGYFGQNRMEENRRFIEQSHRTVIILTEQFIKDDSSMSTLYEGFQNMIFSQSKLIFILLPGVKEHVDQRAKTEPSYKVIQRAISLSHLTILWSNKKHQPKNLKFQFEYAMPKLKSQKNLQNSNNTTNYTTLCNDESL